MRAKRTALSGSRAVSFTLLRRHAVIVTGKAAIGVGVVIGSIPTSPAGWSCTPPLTGAGALTRGGWRSGDVLGMGVCHEKLCPPRH